MPSENPLIERLKLRRYKRGNPQKVLDSIHKKLRRSRYGRNSWDLLVELLADKLRPMELEAYGISLLPETKHKDLADKFSEELEHYIVAAKERPWDYLGEVFIEHRLDNTALGQNLTPKGVIDMMVKMTMGDENEIKELKTVLDPCVGTGRFLLETSLLYPNAPLRLYGIEIDLSLYRACVVNLSLFSKHPFTILCGNTLLLPQTCYCNHPIWLLGNRWDPPDLSGLYPKPPPATETKFKLSEWTKKHIAGI